MYIIQTICKFKVTEIVTSMAKPAKNKAALISSEISLHDFFGKDTLEKASELFEYINKPLIKRNQIGMEYYMIRWYGQQNVLFDNLKLSRKFTFAEFMWIEVLKELRLFNLPNTTIAKLRTKLFESVSLELLSKDLKAQSEIIESLNISRSEKKQLLALLENKNNQELVVTISFFQLMLLECILKRKPMGLAVFTNGEYLILDKSKQHLYSKSDLDLLNSQSHITIWLSGIISRFLQSDMAFELIPELNILSKQETVLYEYIQSGNYESIIIHFKNKKMKSLELKKNQSTKEKIVNILREGEFAEITIKKHKGEIVKIEQSIKIAF